MPSQTRHTNRILRHLAPDALELIEKHLEPVEYAPFTTLLESGEPIEHVIFPETGMVSFVSTQMNGDSPELVGVGREGVVGCIAAVGSREAYTRWLVQVDFRGLRCPASVFQKAFDSNRAFRQHIVCYMEAVFCQAMQSVACNASHPVAARASRWLLMMHDRAEEDRLELTQEFLAEILSVHRSSIVTANAALERAGFIRSSRGSITVVDRRGLQDAACECYTLIKSRYEDLLPGTFDEA